MTSERDSAIKSRQPSLAVCIAVAALLGCVADYGIEDWSSSRWAVLSWVALASTAALGLLRIRARSLVFLAAFAIGAGWHHYRFFDIDDADLAAQLWQELDRDSRPIEVRGVIGDLPLVRQGSYPGSVTTWTLIRLEQARDLARPEDTWRAATGWIHARIRGKLDQLRMGEPIEATGAVGWIAPPLNPGEFDEREHWQAQGVRLRLEINSPNDLHPNSAGAWSRPLSWLGQARVTSYRRLTAYLNEDSAALAAALLLGRREAIEPRVFDEYFRTGTLHLLAISGLHFQALAAAIGFGMRYAGASRRRIDWTVGPLLLGYAVLVGGMPSVVRSCAMAAVLTTSLIRHRQSRPSSSMAAAVLATLALNPAHFRNAGCLLSFAAVAAIFWGAHPLWTWMRERVPRIDRIERRFDRGPRRVRRWLTTQTQGLFLVSSVVWVATLPMTAYCFHQISPIGILLNVPLVPLSSLALLAAGLTLILGLIWSPLAMPAAWVCQILLRIMKWVVHWGASAPGSGMYVPAPPIWWLVGSVAVFGYLCVRRGTRARWGIALLLPSWLMLGWGTIHQPNRPERPEAEVLAVGHGLAVILQDSDGRAALYDCGRQGDESVGRRIIAPALWSRGISRLEFVALSHADADHYNGLSDLLTRFRIDAVLVPPGFPGVGNPGATRLMNQVVAQGIPVLEISVGDRMRLGQGLELTAAHPPPNWRGVEDNDGSLVLTVDGPGGGRLLLPGDLTGLGLFAVREQNIGPFDVMASPHHGATAANPLWILDSGFAKQIIVSQSRRDARSASDPIRLHAADRSSRTWERGAIRAVWTQEGMALHGFLDATIVAAMPSVAAVLVGTLAVALGFAVAAVIAIIEWGAWTLVRPRPNAGSKRKSPADLPPNDESAWEKVQITAADGAKLAGDWRSREDRPSRVLAMVHGFGEARASMRPRGGPPARQGWAVLAVDLRAFGDSEGRRFAFGGREAEDLRRWVDWIVARSAPGVRIVLWGRSMGAAIAMRAASEDDRIAALILEAPYLSLKQSLARWLVLARLPRWLNLAPAILLRANMRAGAPLDRPTPLDLASRIRVPVWIFHGQDDGLVPIEHARLLAQAIGDNATLTEIPDARHGNVYGVGAQALEERASVFLTEAAEASAAK